MSVNPLFTGPAPNKRPPIYSNHASPSQRAGNVLCQTNLHSGNMNFRDSPLRKKPRMSDPGRSQVADDADPFQGFDSFSADDLESFDMIASQALSQQPRPDLSQPANTLKRPASASRFLNQAKTNSVTTAANAQVGSKNSIVNTPAPGGYGSVQQANSFSNTSRFSFKSTSSRGGPMQAPASSGLPNRTPTPTIPQAHNRSPARQSNVAGTKIYDSSHYHRGSTPPSGHEQGENLDSTKAQTLRPNRVTVLPKPSVQSNIGPKIANSASKREPYLGIPNPTRSVHQSLHVDTSNRSFPFPGSANPGLNPYPNNSNIGGNLNSAPSQGGGRGTTSLTPPKGAVARESPGLPTTGRDTGLSHPAPALQQQQVAKYRSECEVARQQVKRFKEEMFSKDGEIQLLRQNLSKAKTEASQLQMQLVQAEGQRKQRISEVEREFKKENESLRTQLQFKEVELMQAHSASQNQRTRPPIPSTSNNAPTTPPKHPTTLVASKTEDELRDSDTFPTQQSFMADNPKVDRGQLRSPRVRTLSEGQPIRRSPKRSPRQSLPGRSPGKASPARHSSVPTPGSSPSAQYGKPPKATKRNCLLSARLQTTSSEEAQLIGSLLQDQERQVTTGGSVGGLVGLIQSTGYDRVCSDATEPALLGQPSPAKPKRVSPNKRSSVDHPNKTSNPGVELATRAISGILNPPQIPPLPPPNKPTVHPATDRPQMGQSSAAEPPDSATSIVDILPLLEDQLTIYIDTTHSITLSNAQPLCSTCPSSSSGSSSSRSLESSLESSGSASPSEESMALDRAESVVLTSMGVLRKMVMCSAAVRSAILHGGFLRHPESPGSDGDVSAIEIDPSAPLIDAPSKSNSSSSGVREPQPQPTNTSTDQRSNRILSKLMRIASMQHGLGSCGAVVELSLDVLCVLAQKSNTEDTERLQPLLVHNALMNSLSRDSTFIQASRALDILVTLSRSWKLSCKLCNQSDSCLLLRCYQCGVHGLPSCSTPQKIQLTVKVISMLWRIIGSHHQGATMLLDTDCQCSVELINAAVLMLRRVQDTTLALTGYDCPTKYWRYVLHEGLLLVHCLAMHDRSFVDHRLDVEKYYVATIASLNKLYRKIPDVTDNETGLVQDLWYFVQGDEAEWELEEEEEDEIEQQGVAEMEEDQ